MEPCERCYTEDPTVRMRRGGPEGDDKEILCSECARNF